MRRTTVGADTARHYAESPNFRTIVSARRISNLRISLSVIFANASAIRNAWGSNGARGEAKDLRSASCAPAKRSETGTLSAFGEVVESGRSDSVDALLVFLNLLVRNFKDFSELLLSHLAPHAPQANPRADEDVDGLRRPGIMGRFGFLGGPRFLQRQGIHALLVDCI